MNIKNLFTLTVRAVDFNLVAQRPELLKQLRKLTLYAYSGLNREMNGLINTMSHRPVRAQVLLAYKQDKLVAWALLSREPSAMQFMHTDEYFHPSDGVLFEVFVHPDYRRQGIATELMKIARRKAGPYRLCVAPWDERSTSFYSTFKNYKNKWL